MYHNYFIPNFLLLYHTTSSRALNRIPCRCIYRIRDWAISAKLLPNGDKFKQLFGMNISLSLFLFI